MRRRILRPVVVLAVVLLCAAATAPAQDLSPLVLPAPVTDGGKPLMAALKARASAREFSGEKLPLQTLSNLLWAAWGINRPDGHRTAPSASNRQEIDIYVVNVGADAGFIAENVYLFCASEGLATVVRASVAKEALGKILKLRDTQIIVLAHSVGYPKK